MLIKSNKLLSQVESTTKDEIKEILNNNKQAFESW